MSNVSNTVKYIQDYTVSNKSYSVVSSKVTYEKTGKNQLSPVDTETTGKNQLSPVDTEHQEYNFLIL